MGRELTKSWFEILDACIIVVTVAEVTGVGQGWGCSMNPFCS